MTPEESKMLAEFVRSEMATGEAFVRRSALVSLAARWRDIANECDDMKRYAGDKFPKMLVRLNTRAQAMREAADDLDKHTGAGSEDNKELCGGASQSASATVQPKP